MGYHMAKVFVKFLSRVKEVAGVKEIEVIIRDGETTRTMLDHLSQRLGGAFRGLLFSPDTNSLRENIIIYVNGENIMIRDGLETNLRDNDLMLISTPAAGG